MTEKVDWSSFEVVDAPSPVAASAAQSGPVDWSSFEVVGPEEKPKTSILRRAGDVGIAALKGAIGVPETAVGLADIVTGGRAGKLAEEAGFRPKEAKAILNEYLSPEQQAANKAVSEAKGFTETAKAALQNPSVIGQQVIESLPSMGAGGLIGRGLVAGARIAPWIAGAAGEGIVGAGQAAEQTRQQVESGLITPKQAAAAMASGIGTAAFGMAGGRIAHRLGIADVDTMLAGGGSALTSKGVAKRIIEGGISEGAFEELPQSIQEQIWQNVAMDKPLLEGVPEAAAMGLITGAAMGGAAGGAFHGHPAVADIGKAQSVDEAISAATASIEPTTPAAAATIGELERTASMATPTAPEQIIAPPEVAPLAAAQPSTEQQSIAPEAAQGITPETAAEPTAIQLAMQQAVSQRESRQREADDLAAIAQDIEANRANKTRTDRMAMLDSILANDEIVGIKSKLARFAGDLQRAGYTNPEINPEEWTHARRYSNVAIGLNEMDVVPVAPAVRVAPNEMPPELVREKTTVTPQKAAAITPLPDEYHDLARSSKNVEQFWKGLNKLGVPMKGRSPLTAGYKAFKKSETANVMPTPAAAVPVRNVGATGAIQAAPERGDLEGVGAPTVQPVPAGLPDTGAVQPAAGVGVPSADEGVQQPAAVNKRQEAIASLESMTGKELRNIAAKDKRAYMRNAAADILQTRSQETRQKRSELAKKIYVKSKQIDPDRDTMAQAIAKLGSINIDSAAGRLRLAPEELNIRGHGVLRVFSKAGRSMDEIGAQLADLGYVQHDANGKYDQTDFEDKLAEVAGGAEVLTPNGMMQRAQENHDQAMQEVGATSEEEYKSVENYADNASDDIQNAIDDAFDFPISQKELSDDEIDSLFGIEKTGGGISEVAAQGQARPSGEGNQAPAAENFLQSESEAEANARLAAAKEKTRLADLELKRLDEVEKHARIQKEIEQRQASSAENFQLGQTAEEAISGQEPLFSKKANESAKKLVDDLREKYPGIKLDVMDARNMVISRIVIPEDQRGQGIGTEIMRALISHADANGKTLTLTPSKDFGGSMPRLKKFYQSLGFVENKGGNKDFEISESMYRLPEKNEIRRSQGQRVSGITADEISKATARLRAKWLDFTKVNIVQSVNDLPADILNRVNPDAQTEGFYDPQTQSVYLIADNIASPERAAWVASHETIGHGGLRMLKDKTVDDAVKMAGMNRFVRELSDAIAKDRGGLAQNIATEEAIAELSAAIETNDFQALTDRYGVDVPASAQSGIRGTIARVVDAVKRFLASVTGKTVADVSDADVRSLIAAQRAAVESAAPSQRVPIGVAMVGQEVLFSKASLGGLNAAQEAAAESVLGKPKTIGQRMQEFKRQWQKNLVQGVFDQFAPIKELSKKAYIQSRMSRGGDSTLEALMMYGKIIVDQDGFYQSDYQKANGRNGFAQAMAKLKGEHDRFFLWVAAHRAGNLVSVGLENLFSQSDIAALKTLSQGQMKDGTPRAALYDQAMKDLNDFNDSVLKIAEDSGLIDTETRKMYKDMPYIPFYRLQEEGIAGFGMKAGLVNQSAWKKLKGGTEKLNEDLMANLLQNWSHLITASSKNRAAKASLDAAVNAGVAAQVPSGAPGKGTVSYREAGKDKTFLVSDSHIMDAISSLEYAGLGPWAKPLTTMKRMLTIGVTANPAFKIRNLIRDSVQAIGTADLSYNPLSNISSGWMATADDSEIRAQMLASGGMIRFGSMLEGNSSQRAKDLINHDIDPAMVLDDDNKVKSFWKGNIQPAIDAYQELGDRGEQVNRAALYQRLIDKGMSHGEASFWARDLMDFSSTGKWQAVRFLTQVVPFMNARLQGLYKLGRAGKQDIKRMGYVTGVVALASIALMAAYKDDDDWKKREDWDRQNYWWFKIGDTAFRIPKPFELGSIGTIAEMGVEYFSSDEMTGKRFVENIGAIVGSQLSMNPIPQLVKPMLDVYANKDSFTKRPIESLAMQRLKPSERYNERTSEVGRFLGSLGLPDPAMLMMGHYEELSPVKIDALTRGYFSWLGVMATTATDYGIRPIMDRGERPTMQLKDAFVIGNFAESLPTNSSRYVSQMYDQANAIEQAYATYQQAIKQGDIEKAKSLMAENRKEIMAHKNIAAIKRRESEINAQINKITSSKTMGADEKRRLIDVLSAKRDQVARMIMH